MCKSCQDKTAALEELAADRLKIIGALGGDIARMQQIIGELQTENTTLRRRIIEAIDHYRQQQAAVCRALNGEGA